MVSPMVVIVDSTRHVKLQRVASEEAYNLQLLQQGELCVRPCV